MPYPLLVDTLCRPPMPLPSEISPQCTVFWSCSETAGQLIWLPEWLPRRLGSTTYLMLQCVMICDDLAVQHLDWKDNVFFFLLLLFLNNFTVVLCKYTVTNISHRDGYLLFFPAIHFLQNMLKALKQFKIKFQNLPPMECLGNTKYHWWKCVKTILKFHPASQYIENYIHRSHQIFHTYLHLLET